MYHKSYVTQLYEHMQHNTAQKDLHSIRAKAQVSPDSNNLEHWAVLAVSDSLVEAKRLFPFSSVIKLHCEESN